MPTLRWLLSASTIHEHGSRISALEAIAIFPWRICSSLKGELAGSWVTSTLESDGDTSDGKGTRAVEFIYPFAEHGCCPWRMTTSPAISGEGRIPAMNCEAFKEFQGCQKYLESSCEFVPTARAGEVRLMDFGQSCLSANSETET